MFTTVPRTMTPSLAGWPRLLLALVLVTAQLLLATHQVTHLSDGHEHKECQVCAIGGGLDHGAVPATDIVPLPASHVDTPPTPPTTREAQPRPHRFIRAPPTRALTT